MLIKDKLQNTDTFTYSEELLSQYFLNKGREIENMSARAIAKDTNNAASTISRFTQKLGFEGFNDFKKQYLDEIHYLETHVDNIDINYPFNANDKNTTIAHKIGTLYHDIIDDNLLLINHDTLQRAINIINHSENIYVISGGVQLDIAQTFKSKMLKIGKKVIIDNYNENQYYQACYGNKNDCFLFISYSGELSSTLKIALKTKENNIPTIAITSIGENTLSSLCDVSLYVSSKEKLIDNLGNFTMNISTLLILDILYVSYFNQNYKKNLINKQNISKEYETKRTSLNSHLKD